MKSENTRTYTYIYDEGRDMRYLVYYILLCFVMMIGARTATAAAERLHIIDFAEKFPRLTFFQYSGRTHTRTRNSRNANGDNAKPKRKKKQNKNTRNEERMTEVRQGERDVRERSARMRDFIIITLIHFVHCGVLNAV